ncbi:MAG: hypothetical protein A2W08_17905 [Candidatus Rokubacteria bacterium RBG_16_73_20]|nr:MAG: hypothetical protein A2W08_17905 [Candidatus Rokubacteria bacterium RBG_16_73_20]
MCDDGDARGTPPRPRWGWLSALTALGIAALAAVDLLVTARAPRVGLECAVVALTYAALAGWARRQRVALDQLDWCAGAWPRVTVRQVASRPAPPAAVPGTAPRSPSVPALH